MTGWQRPSRASFVQLLVCTAALAFVLALAVPAVLRARESANLAHCKDNLRQLGLSLRAYESLDGGVLPVSPTIENPQGEFLQALAAAGLLPKHAIFYCPSEPKPDLRYSEERFQAGIIDYYYYSAFAIGPDKNLSKFLRSGVEWPRKLSTAMEPRTWVMSDRWSSGVTTNHVGYRKGVNYLALDGSVGFISQSPRQAFR